jgi:hypothetical protein
MADTECGGLVSGRSDAGQSQGSQSEHCSAWPSRPGEQQYAWEPPRVVGDTKQQHDGWTIRTNELSSGQGGIWPCGESLAETDRQQRQTQPPLGGDPDGPSSGLDYAQLCVTCDNRTDELRLLGNGVVPATAERAFRSLMQELDINHPVS